MLHFSKLFNLRDIYQKIPREQLKIPEVTEEYLDEISCRLCIVGQERDGSILVARDGYDQATLTRRTYIDLYDTNTRELHTLYKHDKVVDCVGCSVNEQRTLFAFTILTKEKKPSDNDASHIVTDVESEDVFQSYIVEIHENGKRYELNIRNSTVQRVQFVHGMSKAKKSYVLFILDKEFIHLYQIATQQKRNVVKIASQPMLFHLVNKKFLWAEWDYRRSCLQVLSHRVPAKEPQDCVLRCHFFSETECRLLYEIPLSIKLPSYISEFDRNNRPFYGVDKRAVAPSANYLQIVHLRGNGVCLCQQHIPHPSGVQSQTSEIKVSIYILHHKLKLDFDIPLNNFDPVVASKTRIYFDSIADMLLLFIPGHHFQLIDCGSEHEPCLSITKSGSEFAPFLPNSTTSSSTSGPVEPSVIVPFGVFSSPFPSQTSTVADLRGKSLLDSKTGICYEFTLAREALLDTFSYTPSELQLQALHLAITHMNDTELVDQIMMFMCQECPQNISTALFKEFLIGCPYMELKHTLNMEQRLLDILPITTLESLKEGTQYKRITCTQLHGYHVVPHATKLCVKKENIPKDKTRRLTFENMSTFSSPNDKALMAVKSTPTSPMRKFFSGWMFDDGLPEPAHSDSDEDCVYSGNLNRNQVIDYIATHINNCFPKDNAQKCRIWARKHQIEQEKKVNKLFNYIHQKRNLDDDDKYSAMTEFQLLELLYYATEELCYPFPKGFPSYFISLAYRCLPRNIFLQYLERGVFRLNESFVEEVLASNTGDSEEDKRFKYQLLSKLKETTSIGIMQKHRENTEFVVSHILNSLPIASNEQPTTDMEMTSRSLFQPMTIYLDALGKQYESRKDVIQYLSEQAVRIMEEGFRDELKIDKKGPPNLSINKSL
eukprot:TRINITY_DN6861_c0_g1_i4.p1 TRINITY_DN6861_c0_g1~~TRINITY_DN6861_c0_g1_i4.p1  ORF type:complete len:887 (-),score=163.41 TRINITY_DN6861_c0_g1_i4:90-2750(-)